MNRSLYTRFPFGLQNIFYGWWIILACFVIALYSGGIIFYGFTAFFDPLSGSSAGATPRSPSP
jgi:hypothetical protein